MKSNPTNDERRNVQVQVRLRPSENRLLRKRAEEQKTTAAFFLRAALKIALEHPSEVVLDD